MNRASEILMTQHEKMNAGRARHAARALFIVCTLCLLAHESYGQERSSASEQSTVATANPPQDAGAPSSQTNATANITPGTTRDETFQLDITERRITREDFHASVSVALDETERGVNVAVGVAADAANINVLLRNVRGQVTFRASLAQIVDLLNARRRAAPTQVAPN